MVVVVVIWLLRKHIAELLKGAGVLERLKLGPSGLELEWVRERLEEAQEAVESARELAATPIEAGDVNDERTELVELVKVSPRAAVVESYTRIDEVLRSIVVADDGPRHPSVRTLARMASDQFLIPEAVSTAIADLAGIRNGLVHGAYNVEATEATQYVDLAAGILSVLRSAPRRT